MIQHAGPLFFYAVREHAARRGDDDACRIFYLIGLLSREKDRDLKDSRHLHGRFAEPLLDTFRRAARPARGPDDVHRIPEYYRLSRERRGPTASSSAWRPSRWHEARRGAARDRRGPRRRDLRAGP